MIRPILFAALVIFYAIRWRPSVLRRIERKNVRPSLVLFEAAILVLVVYQLSGLEVWTFPAPAYVSYGGLAMALFGAVIGSSARLMLKKNYLPGSAAAPSATLTTGGFYRVIRHPSYAGTIIAFIGFEAALNSYLILLALPLSFFTVKQIGREERMLSNLHKDAWKKFARDTPYKLIPFMY